MSDGRQARLVVVVRAHCARWDHERAILVRLSIDGYHEHGWLLIDDDGLAHRLAEYRYGVRYERSATREPGADPPRADR